jgi:electron transfer flavoprotein beta subunit
LICNVPGKPEKPFRIIVPIKQVPETSSVRLDEKTGVMIREGVESIVNPLDLYAIETSVRLKETAGGRVTAISMGPMSAQRSLREALSMGCDDAVLISGPEFAGSDTWATSLALSAAIRKTGPFDLVICGERATDGETGQVGPGLASFLGIPIAAYTSRIAGLEKESIVVERSIEDGYEILRLALPALLTVVKEIGFPRLPTLRGKQRARKMEIPVWSCRELGLEAEEVGLKGSPTRVERIFRPRVARRGVKVQAPDDAGAEHAVEQCVAFLQERKLL